MFNLGIFGRLPFNRPDDDGPQKVSLTYTIDPTKKKTLHLGIIEQGALSLYKNTVLYSRKDIWESIGEITSDAVLCSLMFDGDFTPGTVHFTFDLNPYIFWIDSAKNLKYCQSNTPDIVETLATDVIALATVRGNADPESFVDPGLFLAYIKSTGINYFRTFGYQGIKTWGDETVIIDAPETGDSLILFNTNIFI